MQSCCCCCRCCSCSCSGSSSSNLCVMMSDVASGCGRAAARRPRSRLSDDDGSRFSSHNSRRGAGCGGAGGGGRNVRRVTKMIFIVTVVFVVCWTPYHIMNFFAVHNFRRISQLVAAAAAGQAQLTLLPVRLIALLLIAQISK